MGNTESVVANMEISFKKSMRNKVIILLVAIFSHYRGNFHDHSNTVEEAELYPPTP
jgi:hypothetical protein